METDNKSDEKAELIKRAHRQVYDAIALLTETVEEDTLLEKVTLNQFKKLLYFSCIYLTLEHGMK